VSASAIASAGRELDGAVVLVTGANRGLGRAFVDGFLARGAAVVYAAVRDPSTVTDLAAADPRVVPVRLDVTDPASVAAAAAVATDVTIVVNNAGIATGAQVTDPTRVGDIRAEMETNFFGSLAVAQAFAPLLAANDGGALVDVLSVASWRSLPSLSGYAASKAAAWSLTNSLRVDLADQGTAVVGVHAGFLDTDLTAGIEAPKTAPAVVVEQVLDALVAGEPEVLADEVSHHVRAGLSSPLVDQYPDLPR